MSENKGSCTLNIPYPPVKTSGRSKRYAALLSGAFGGQVSEMTAITLYLYQHFISTDEKLADTLSCIARVEMRHLDILGELISEYGALPRIGAQAGRGVRFWSGQYVSYETNPKVFLKKNIVAEEDAIYDYRRLIKQIDDENTMALLERIILDEEHHIKLFTELLQEL